MYIERHFFKIEHATGNLSKYLAPKIRGILGHGLKKQYCSNYYIKCEECNLTKTCKYMEMFKPVKVNKSAGSLFTIYSKKKSQKNICSITTVGCCITLKEISDSFKIMRDEGLGGNKLPYNIKYESTKTFHIDKGWLDYIAKQFSSKYWVIQLKTPFNTSKPIEDDLLMSSVINRVKSIDSEIKDFITRNQMATLHILDKELKFERLYKFAGESRLNLSGYTGNILVEINLEAFLLLKIAEILHIGKNISFGCGKITLEKGI